MRDELQSRKGKNSENMEILQSRQEKTVKVMREILQSRLGNGK